MLRPVSYSRARCNYLLKHTAIQPLVLRTTFTDKSTYRNIISRKCDHKKHRLIKKNLLLRGQQGKPCKPGKIETM